MRFLHFYKLFFPSFTIHLFNLLVSPFSHLVSFNFSPIQQIRFLCTNAFVCVSLIHMCKKEEHNFFFLHQQILCSDTFKRSTRISVYLSLSHEVDTNNLLVEMFRQQKQVSHLKWYIIFIVLFI